MLRQHFLVCLVGKVLMAQLGFELTHKKPLAGTLLAAHLVLDYLAQVGDGFLVFASVDIVVGVSVVPLFLGMAVDGVAAHVANHVFGIVEPLLLDVAFRKPGAGLAIDGGLGLVEAAHVGEGGGSFVERSLVKLRTTHQHPGFPHHGVVFAPIEPLDVAGGLAAALRPFGTLVDAVQLNGFLTLFDGAVEIA